MWTNGADHSSSAPLVARCCGPSRPFEQSAIFGDGVERRKRELNPLHLVVGWVNISVHGLAGRTPI
jgi:hypothetical protein